jgi:hypothetical protein
MPRRDDDYDDRYDERDNDRDEDRLEDRYSRRDDRRSRRDDNDDDYDDGDDYDRRRWREPHRGTLILVLGICGLVVCGLCAPAAWIMGSADLAKMRAGSMDPSGYGSTQAGWVLGIIGTLLILAAVAFLCVLFGIVGVNAR